MKRLLFVCARNRLRSPTAEAIFAGVHGVECASAGTALDAECRVSGDLIEWADIVIVMEKRQKTLLMNRFGDALREKRVVCLGIPDRYDYMEPALVKLLEAKMRLLLNT